MGRKTKPPTYTRHRGAKGVFHARTRVNGREVSLGRYGSPESYAEFERIIIEWRRAQVQQARQRAARPDEYLTVADVAARFLEYAEGHYRRSDGTYGTEVGSYARAFRPLIRLHGYALARDFGPLALKAVRQQLVTEDLSRGFVNQCVNRIRHLFKWAESEELVPAATYQALQTVAGLRCGEARETGGVLPVPEEVLARTLPVLNPIVRAIVEVQLLTGARPGEVLRLRPQDFDRSGKVELMPGLVVDTGMKVWSVRLADHKTAYRGQHRVLLIGPKAQTVLQPLLEGRASADFLFSPQEVVAQWQAEKRLHRKSKVQPSQQDRRKRSASRLPGRHYAPASYHRAIQYAIERANNAAACTACREKKPPERCADCQRNAIPRWHPYQLRHNAATRLVEQFGWDVARIVLGHRQISTTRIYAVDDVKKAAGAMMQCG